jgi:hypothetical protein
MFVTEVIVTSFKFSLDELVGSCIWMMLRLHITCINFNVSLDNVFSCIVVNVIVGELEKLLLLNAIDVLELTLSIPILIKQVVITLKLLSDFSYKM